MSSIARYSSSATSPSASRTRAAVSVPSPSESAWSARESASRIEPSAARESITSASGSDFTFSAASTEARRVRTSAGPMRLKSKRWSAAQHRRGGLRDLLRLRGGEHEHDARRRLLEDLEQRIPRLAREHVRFVHDVHLVAGVAVRRVHRALAQLTRVVHAAVRRGIDLDDVERGGSAPDPLARFALAARLAVGGAVLAIERHREHARERRLPHSARAAQQVAVRDAAARDRALERVRDVGLHRDIGEAPRAILTGEREIHGPRKTRARRHRRQALVRVESSAGARPPLAAFGSPRSAPGRPKRRSQRVPLLPLGPGGVDALAPSGTWSSQ